MYLWIALPAGIGSASFARRALEDTGALVLPGASFGPAGEGYFRIALTASGDRLEEAARRLERVLASTPRGELATSA
jgi:LL-diaminopimelate aminotransferase